jgi:hypothetical protein
MTRLLNNRTGIQLDQSWADMLRADCIVLTESPRFASAISVSKAFARGHEAERDAVIELAQRLAEEYGLLVRIEVEGHFVTIRFSRKGRIARPAAPVSKEVDSSLLGRLRGFILGTREGAEPEPAREAQGDSTGARS